MLVPEIPKGLRTPKLYKDEMHRKILTVRPDSFYPVWGALMASPLRLLPSPRLPLLLLLALAAALLALPSAESTQASAAQSVPSDWEHIPQGIKPGDSFRLLFVTSATRDASSSNIADYNAHVQGAAGGNDSLKSFKGQFTALISTSAVDARENTGTTGTGVPVHWLGGEKVADDYADLYDKSWDSVSGRTESGGSYTGLVWTGGNKMGQKSGQRYAGAAEVRLGDLGDATLPLSSPAVKASGEAYPLYALSPVFTVAEPEPEPTPTPTPEPTLAPTPTPAPDNDSPTITSGPVIASNPASGDTYGKGETIKVAITFGEAVTVTGQPYVRLAVGERGRRARYSSADGATLTFAYTFKSNDRDGDGVSIPGNAVRLNGGTIQDADGNGSSLEHPALPDQAGHRVNGAREEPPAEGQQQAANAAPSFAADTAARSVDENSAAGTNVGDPITATDDDGDALTYAISGSDAFAIDVAGQITVLSAPDHETQSSYALTVTVSDGKNAQGDADTSVDDSIAVTVTIVDVDEPGSVSLNLPMKPIAITSSEERVVTHMLFAPGVGSLHYDEFYPPQMTRIQTATRITATLSEPDSIVAGSLSWKWYRSPAPTVPLVGHIPLIDQLGPWSALSGNGADTDTYTVQHADAGQYLLVKAEYTDSHGSKTVSVATARVTRDNVHPYPFMDIHKPARFPYVNAPFDITVRFSEPVVDFTADTLHVVNATIGNFSEQHAGRRYTATVTPLAEGNVHVSVPKDSVTDMFGNKNEGRAWKDTHYDVTPPSMSFALNPGRYIRKETFYLSMDFSEYIADHTFTVDDLVIVNASAREFAKSRFRGIAYEVLIVPDEGLSHGDRITVTLPAGAVADEAGNLTQNDAVFSTEIDLEGVTATLTPHGLDRLDETGSFTVDIQFSQPVTSRGGAELLSSLVSGLRASDLSVKGGFVKSLVREKPLVTHTKWTTTTVYGESDGEWEAWEVLTRYTVTYAARYTATIVVRDKSYGSAAKPIEVSIPRNTVQDEAGNPNGKRIGPLKVTRPVPEVTLEGPAPTNGRKLRNEPFDVTVRFSEEVVGFNASQEVEISGGAVKAAKKTSGPSEPNAYLLTIDPDGPGALRLTVPADVARSKATRRFNQASETLRYTITAARSGPAVTIDSGPPPGAPDLPEQVERPNHPFNVMITFSEDVVGFRAVSEVEISGGTVTAAFKVSAPGEPGRFLIYVKPDGPGTLELKVPAEVARSRDTRRFNQESNTLTYTICASSPPCRDP